MLVEFIGTGILVLVGCGSCTKFEDDEPTDVVRISLAFGLSVGTIVWAIAHISGGHINPAVTIGFFVTRKISLLRAVLYFCFQVVGGIAGAGILKVVSPYNPNDTLCSPQPSDGIGYSQTFLIEAIITFVLVLTFFASCDALRTGFGGSGPLAIGLAIGMCHLWAVSFEGSSMNPARALGPSLVSGFIFGTEGLQAIYWFGPLVGGIVAALLYDFLLAVNSSLAKTKAFFSELDYDDSQFDKNGRKVDEEHTPMLDGEPVDDDSQQLKGDHSPAQYGAME